MGDERTALKGGVETIQTGDRLEALGCSLSRHGGPHGDVIRTERIKKETWWWTTWNLRRKTPWLEDPFLNILIPVGVGFWWVRVVHLQGSRPFRPENDAVLVEANDAGRGNCPSKCPKCHVGAANKNRQE